jgi:hypothetical protein
VSSSLLHVAEGFFALRGRQKVIDGGAFIAPTTDFSNIWHSRLPWFGPQDVLKVGSNDNPKEFTKGIRRYLHAFSRQHLPQFGDQRTIENLKLVGQVLLAFED